MTIVTVGIDLAKNVFAVHGVDETGKPALVRPNVWYALTNERDFPVPNEPRTMRLAVYGNYVPRWRG